MLMLQMLPCGTDVPECPRPGIGKPQPRTSQLTNSAVILFPKLRLFQFTEEAHGRVHAYLLLIRTSHEAHVTSGSTILLVHSRMLSRSCPT